MRVFKAVQRTYYLKVPWYFLREHLSATWGFRLLNYAQIRDARVSFPIKIKRFGEGTTFHEISKKFVEDIEVDVPDSLQEQTTIARILSTVDKTIEQTEQLIAKYQRIKTGLMQDLLTRGIDEHGRIRSEAIHRFKDSPLGRIPEEWELVKIGEIIDYL